LNWADGLGVVTILHASPQGGVLVAVGGPPAIPELPIDLIAVLAAAGGAAEAVMAKTVIATITVTKRRAVNWQ
jgi:hypothetical protein